MTSIFGNPFKEESDIVEDIKRIMEGKEPEAVISEGGIKAAIEDFMYDTLPQAAVKDLKPIFKDQSVRGSKLRDKVSAVLKKHKVPTFAMGTSAAQIVIDNFDTFFGESVEEHGEVLSEAAAMIPFKRILKGVNDMEGPFLIVVMRKGAPGAILQKKVPGRAALPAHINYMLSNDLQKLEWKAIAIENAKGKIVNIMYPTDVLTKAGSKPSVKKEEVEMEAYGNPFTPTVPGTIAAPNFKAGDKVKVPHKGKMVKGKIVRYDDGGTWNAKQTGGGYVVDVGEPASILVPKQSVQKEEAEVNELTNLRTYNNAYPNTMIASSKEMGEETNDQAVKAAILTLQSAVNMASNPSKYGNLKVINAIEQAIKQLKSATK